MNLEMSLVDLIKIKVYKLYINFNFVNRCSYKFILEIKRDALQ